MADPVDRLLAAFSARRPMRTGSLIITTFGDVIVPRGGAVLLADLIRLLAAFGVNDSQVRTAVSRLAADGWLAPERLGRHSLYRLSESGRHRFAEATRRIYAGPPERWNGHWHVVVMPAARPARDELRKDLGWLGFGSLAPGVMLHPCPDKDSLASVIDDLPPGERPLLVAGADALPAPPATLQALVEQSWDLDALAAAYERFIGDFAALDRALGDGFAPPPLPALLARLMLIHDYRRIVLRDPMLPRELMPRGWSGAAAYAAARRIYRRLVPASERWVDAELHAGKRPLPAPAAAFAARFR